tara:strand:- start:1862 stop:2473 length:612 start_codon:yes stop_codon:yes gene_type:complete
MKILNSIFRILKDYKFYIFIILYFEVYFYLKNYKGFKINYSSNNRMADNIPCPFFFLYKIKKKLNNYKFKSFIDLGCGSGRILYFFNKNFKLNKILGIEYYSAQYNYCKMLFKSNKNISIKKLDFLKIDFKRNNYDIIFLSAPFNQKKDFKKFMKKLSGIKKLRKKIIIIVNYDIKLIKTVKNIKLIDEFYLSKEKGYSICSF